MRKYSKVKSENDGVISKYIICPGYNDNKEEIDKWLNTCKNIGIRTVVISVENIWLKGHRRDGNSEVIKLVEYILNKGKNMFASCKGENHVMQLLAGVED